MKKQSIILPFLFLLIQSTKHNNLKPTTGADVKADMHDQLLCKTAMEECEEFSLSVGLS